MIAVYLNRKPCMVSLMTSHFTLSDLERSSSKSLRFQSLISCKGAELSHILLLKINRKAYMGSPVTPSHLTLGGEIQDHSKFQSLVKEHMLLLNINRKAYMGSPMTPSHLTLSDLERSNPRSLGFRSVISCKRSRVRPYMLLFSFNTKADMESLMTSSHMTLSDTLITPQPFSRPTSLGCVSEDSIHQTTK